jgi:hypothetical protein
MKQVENSSARLSLLRVEQRLRVKEVSGENGGMKIGPSLFSNVFICL